MRRKDPFYQIITAAAQDELADRGEYDREEVIERAGFGEYKDIALAANWNRVDAILAEETGNVVMKVAEPPAPVNGAKPWDPATHPEKFMPGAGRPATGSALPGTYPQVALKTLERRAAMAVGFARSLDRLAVSFQAQGIPITYQPGSAAVLSLAAAAE